VKIAESDGFDLIVLGTHGRSGRPRMLAGSVAESVVRTASRPVLTVREAP
jgi:nucleotide-binding universal stress UspA family protein